MNIPVKYLNRFEHKKFDSFKIAYFPSLAVVSLSQDGKTLMESLVKPGDIVSEGQIIAKKNSCKKENKKYPASVNSPVPGIVKEISFFNQPNGKSNLSVLIKMEGSFNFSGKKKEIKHKNDHWKNLSVQSQIKKISEKGIINTFDNPVSLAEQLSAVIENNENIPIAIRLFDSEPDCSIESFTSSNFQSEIITGAAIVANLINSPHVVFISDKIPFKLPDEKETKDIFSNSKADVCDLKDKTFPTGTAAKICKLTNAFLNEKYNNKFSKMLTLDAQTCIDVYNGIVKSYPAVDRLVQVDGDVLNQSQIFRVKIGTPIKNLFSECDGFSEKFKKIIINGMIKGTEIYDFETPITRYVRSVFVVSGRGMPDKKENVCIRCGKCRDVCPEFLRPEKIYENFVQGTPVRQMVLKSITTCTECGLCNTVCPSRLPLYQTIQTIKEKNNEKEV
ncbi:MAG: 4Fe-4S dicluster domain-containing protein [Treponemataceae bacterium]